MLDSNENFLFKIRPYFNVDIFVMQICFFLWKNIIFTSIYVVTHKSEFVDNHQTYNENFPFVVVFLLEMQKILFGSVFDAPHKR